MAQCNKPDDHPIGRADLAALKDAVVVFVIGGPGSGKGTQCAKIVEKYGFTHLSSGDLLREEVKSGSERGQKLTQIMAIGELVPLDTVLELLKEAMISRVASSRGFLIDGYPREMDQGIRFEKEVAEAACALYFDVSDDTMTKRLLGRAQTSGRVDDNEETIKKRLKTFHDMTKPVIEHYTTMDKVKKIDAERSTEEIFRDVEGILEELLSGIGLKCKLLWSSLMLGNECGGKNCYTDLMKLGMDEVFKFPYKCCCFSAGSAEGGAQ